MGKLRETETEQAVLVLSSVPVPGPCLCRGLAMLFTLWVLDPMDVTNPRRALLVLELELE